MRTGRQLISDLEWVFLDFDGLICDTEAAARRAWEELFRSRGSVLPAILWQRMRGRSDGHLIAEAAVAELTGGALGSAEREWRLARKHELADAEPLCPGVDELLEAAAVSGTKLAVVSSGEVGWVRHHLDRLSVTAQLSAVITRADVRRSKPDPEPYRVALDRTGAEPDRVLVFEDSSVGLESATAAGLRCVLVSEGPLVIGQAWCAVASLSAFLEEAPETKELIA